MTLVAALEMGPADCWACRTPVYRYAMYNWPAAPCYVFYFYYGQVRQEDAQVNKWLQALPRDKQPASVVLQEIDASDESNLGQLPKVVAKDFRRHSDGKSPIYLVYTSWGSELFAGQLDMKTVEVMFDSPARQRLGQLLHQGNACVWIVLSSSDAQWADKAEKVAQDVAAAVAAGKILADLLSEEDDPAFHPLPPAQPVPPASPGIPKASPGDASEQQPGSEQAGGAAETEPGESAVGQPRLKAAVLRVARDDPAEVWLVRALISLEPDLKQYQTEPMVFPVFGRGRVLPPFVGRGITSENLTECLAYVAGPCSCQVKDENPGFDLMMRWDWEATADALAAAEREQSSRRAAAYMEIDPAAHGKASSEPGVAAAQPPFSSDNATSSSDNATSDSQSPASRPHGAQPAACCQGPVVAGELGNLEHSGQTVAFGTSSNGLAGSFRSRLWLTAGLVLTGAFVAVLLIGTVLLRRQG